MRKAESSIKLNRVQQADHISLKQKLLKIGHFCARPESALGTGALPLGASLDSITWKDEVVELCGTLRKLRLQFDYISPSERTVRVAFALIPHDFLNDIIQERTCN